MPETYALKLYVSQDSVSSQIAEEKQNLVQLGAHASIAKGSLDKMAQNIRWVLEHPDEAHARCRTGDIIGIDGVFERRITGELLNANARLKRMLQTLSDGILVK